MFSAALGAVRALRVFGGTGVFLQRWIFQASVIPSSVRRGGCGIKKISAKPTLTPQMMRWTPPGDLNGIKVPKSSRCLDHQI